MNKFLKAVLIVLVILGAFFGLLVLQVNSFFSNMSPCIMSEGPVYGDTIQIDLDTFIVDDTVHIPDGKFIFGNLKDTLSPKMVKLDWKNNIEWALEFKDDIGFPYQKLSEMTLVEDEHGIRITFYNDSFSESGRIYLTDRYEIEYMCLSMM